MSKDVDLKKGELTRHVNKAAKAIADGFIIIIPMESSYAFACDAYRADTVRAMHTLRGDPLFTAAQLTPLLFDKYTPLPPRPLTPAKILLPLTAMQFITIFAGSPLLTEVQLLPLLFDKNISAFDSAYLIFN